MKEGEGGAFALFTGLSFADSNVSEGQGLSLDRHVSPIPFPNIPFLA